MKQKNNWQIKKLGEVCDIYQPKTISKKEMFVNGKFPVFGANGIIGKYDKYNHENSELLITCRGATCGSVNISNPKSWINGNAMVVRPMDNAVLAEDFLKYFFIGIDLSSVITGSAQPQITRQTLAPFRIPLPPISEQKRIVKILDEVFEKIEKAKENAKKNLENSKELFEISLEKVLKEIKLIHGERKLGEFCHKVEYGTSAKSKKEGDMIVLRMGNIQNGKFIWDKLVYSDNAVEIKKYQLNKDDVLFNRTNSPELVGKTAIYKGEKPAIFAGYLIRIHRKKDLLDASYLNYFLNSRIARDYGKSVMTSSVNQANINGSKLKDYPIYVPFFTKQRQIVKKLNTLSKQTKKLEKIYQQKLDDLEELKKSVLKKAFNGEL